MTRIPGADRYATSANVAADFGPDTVPPAVVYVASGTGFADGLSGTPVVARGGTVLLLAAGQRARAGQHPHGDLRADAAPRSWSSAGPASCPTRPQEALGQPCP